MNLGMPPLPAPAHTRRCAGCGCPVAPPDPAADPAPIVCSRCRAARGHLLRLRLAAAARVEVEIAVSDCLYACCARPATRRHGYAQVYRGVVADVDERRLVLHSLALGALNYHVIVELANLDDVAVVD